MRGRAAADDIVARAGGMRDQPGVHGLTRRLPIEERESERERGGGVE